jgi:malonyl-CoA/methylmalonyl-CoA synthetase
MPASRLLARWHARGGDRRAAIYDPSGTATWLQVIEGAECVASTLLDGRRSLEGERVALLVSPGAAFVSCFFGVLRAGGVGVGLSLLHPAPETLYFCEDAGARTIVVSRDLAHHLAFLSPSRRVVFAESLVEREPGRIDADPGEEDAALQLYTSGTTGKPKGAVITHANLSVQQELLSEAWGLSEGDVLLHVLPLHHMHGLAIALLSTLGAGAGVHFVHTSPFDAPRVWEAMARTSVVMAVPTIHAKLFGAFDAADRTTRERWTRNACAQRLVTSGSAALPVTTGERWRVLTGAYPLERFGMTEIGVGMSNPLAAAARRPGTVGTPLPTVRTRIIDDFEREAQTGELWVAGPSVFAHYHRRPEATRDAFASESGQRWFKTGDTVARDADGSIRVLGRTSVDILKSGGYKLSALEIEEVLRGHPAIAEVAVVGVPDPLWGERVVACIVPHEGHETECSETSVRAFAKERLATYKVPSRVAVMGALPHNALGKVMKPELVKKLI